MSPNLVQRQMLEVIYLIDSYVCKSKESRKKLKPSDYHSENNGDIYLL